jgi:hypothetical protein
MGPEAVPEHQIMAHYDLAKFWSGQNEHDAAFNHWQAGHALLRRFQPFSREAHGAFVDTNMALLDRARFVSGARAGNADPTPVFIVGMPRSGTTLCEQILAAHAQVHGAGERVALGQAFASLGGGHDTAAAVRRIAELDAGTLDLAAAPYLAELHALAPDKTRIVDKMPGKITSILAWWACCCPGRASSIACATPATSACRSSPSGSTAIMAMRTISPISAGPSRNRSA